MEIIRQDIRHAVRALRNSPSFTVPALATLALGIGAATAIFTVFDRVVLRPLPYDEPNQLVYIDSRVRSQGNDAAWGVSEAGYFYLRDNNRTFEDLGAFGAPGSDPQFTMARASGGLRVNGAWVRASLLEVLRARPLIGRLIQEGDDRPGLPSVALLSREFWLREYGGDRNVIGKTLELEGGWRVEVIGVLQPGFHLPNTRSTSGYRSVLIPGDHRTRTMASG